MPPSGSRRSLRLREKKPPGFYADPDTEEDSDLSDSDSEYRSPTEIQNEYIPSESDVEIKEKNKESVNSRKRSRQQFEVSHNPPGFDSIDNGQSNPPRKRHKLHPNRPKDANVVDGHRNTIEVVQQVIDSLNAKIKELEALRQRDQRSLEESKNSLVANEQITADLTNGIEALHRELDTVRREKLRERVCFVAQWALVSKAQSVMAEDTERTIERAIHEKERVIEDKERIIEDKERIIEDRERIIDETLCVCCLENRRNVTFDKCAHLAFCDECERQNQSKECPICRTAYTRTKTLLF